MSWPTRRLSELVEFRNGLNFAADDRGGDLPIVGVGDFGRGRLRGSKGLETVKTPPDLAPEALLRVGDLLFVRSNGNPALVGRCMLVEALDYPTTHSGFTIRARVTSPDIDPRWAACFFESGMARQSLGLGASGTNITNLSQGILADLEIPLPPVNVQQRYLSIIARFDAQASKFAALVKAKRTLKRGLMQELLTGRRRLPGFTGEWVRVPLGQFFIQKNHRNRDESVSTVLSCSKVHGIVPQSQRFSKRLASARVAHYKVVGPGDLVYDPMLLWDASIGFVREREPGVVSPAYATFAINPETAATAFFRHALFTYGARHAYRVISRGTNVRRKKAMPEDFLRITIPVPPTLEEQQRLGAVLDTVDREMAMWEQLEQAYSQQKHGLMLGFLSGEVEAPEHDASVQEPAHA